MEYKISASQVINMWGAKNLQSDQTNSSLQCHILNKYRVHSSLQ